MKNIMKNMKKRILMWLFGTDNMEEYFALLYEVQNEREKHISAINGHIETLHNLQDNLNIERKLIKICENHGIDVDKEIKEVEL